MKKVLLAIAAVATITSCSQNEEFENPAQNAEINFSTIVSKSTRAVIIENKDFKKFTAYGYSHGETNFTGVVTSTIMSSAEYTKGEDGGWTTSGRYYWPTSGKVTFFGYGGVATATYAKEDGKFPTLKYTVLTDINKQEDLLVAQQANKSKENNNPSVNLNFKHALAQVYFKLKGNDADLTYTVSKIELNKVRTEGLSHMGVILIHLLDSGL
ncbi:fimbrillin family protein [Bacteroides thetaiotaomicron]|uniref:fimbrillin family protein n=1 Tax=Bacteroides thetaiotaomicron TaxID=818 RepID=UPI0021651B4F|nr:fimbrillin family protein [Bacteroides thetaiotaomicron]MCS2617312.1 fimbrillin family protein [Bacteroides thetaiotaomicron]